MRVGLQLRYISSADPDEPYLDGSPNYMYLTKSEHGKKLILERGIYAPAPTRSPSGPRWGIVLIRSTSRTAGSESNPWHDYFDPNSGTVIYYGDAKPSTTSSPHDVYGNKLLLQVRDLHTGSAADRAVAPPLVFFQSESPGYVTFQGYGIIERAELVTQLDSKTGVPFTNYKFDCAVFSLTRENENFHWEWIDDRRNPALTTEEALHRAPAAWRRWVRDGEPAIEVARRRVFYAPITKVRDQLPEAPSQGQLLKGIYDHYEGKKHAFEALAEVVVEQVMREAGLKYTRGWVTKKSSDGGVDFVGRIDLGTGFGSVKVVVLGQAKCESPNKPTSGKDLARTVARLRRGWLGVYVTTGLFSEKAQEEIIEDEYPLMLINGATVAAAVRRLMIRDGISDVGRYLDSIDLNYQSRLVKRRPAEVLFATVDLEGTPYRSEKRQSDAGLSVLPEIEEG